MPRIVAVRALDPFRVWLRFDDGREGVADLGPVFALGGVFEPLRAPKEFAKVRLEPGFGTIVWPGGVDLDPAVLYSQVTGLPIEAALERA